MSILDHFYQESILHEYRLAIRTFEDACFLLRDREKEKSTPFYMLRPKLFIDGGKWCALYGENIQDGVCGFGDSPREAAKNFDDAFNGVAL